MSANEGSQGDEWQADALNELFSRPVRKVTRTGRSTTVHFGTNDIRIYTKDVPCRIWRVYDMGTNGDRVGMADGVTHVQRQRCTKTSAVERATNEAAKGSRVGAVREWVEVRPDVWRPPSP